MKNSSILVVVLIIICSGAYALSRIMHEKNLQNTPKIDFFAQPAVLKADYLQLFSRKYKPLGGPIPRLLYRKKGTGIATILCIPLDMNVWNKRAQAKKDYMLSSDSIGRKIKTIITSKSEQQKFHIYSFFTNETDVYEQIDGPDKGMSLAKFPSNVFVYRKSDTGWTYLKTVLVKNWSEFANLGASYAYMK